MMTDIHNNLAPIQINYFSFLDWIILIFLILILIWVYFNFFYIKEEEKKVKIKKKKKFKAEKFSFSDELAELEKMREEKKWKEFALKATRILKLVLEEKYQESFLFATGKELIEILSHKKISEQEKKELKYFFDLLDPIKFAKKKNLENADEVLKILTRFKK